jgi:hypothetical protein
MLSTQRPRRRSKRRPSPVYQTRINPTDIPHFSAVFQQSSKTMRFNATTLSSAVISTIDLFNLLCVSNGANVTSNAYPIIAALRLRRVRVYAPCPAIGSSGYCNVEFSISNSPGNVGVKPTTFADTTLSVSRPAIINVTPPKNSAAAMWQYRPANASTGGTAILMNYSAKAVVDIVMDYVIQNGETPPTVLNTNNHAAGTVFLNTLDNTTNNDLVPDPSQAQ